MLYHTSRNPYLLALAEDFELAGNFVFGLLFDWTSIENNNVSIFDIVCIRKSAVDQHCFDSCTIGVIHLATEY